MRHGAALITVIFMVFLAAGCGRPKEPKSSKVVEDFTGITTIKQGEAIKKKLKEVEKTEEERFKELEEIE